MADRWYLKAGQPNETKLLQNISDFFVVVILEDMISKD